MKILIEDDLEEMSIIDWDKINSLSVTIDDDNGLYTLVFNNGASLRTIVGCFNTRESANKCLKGIWDKVEEC